MIASTQYHSAALNSHSAVRAVLSGCTSISAPMNTLPKRIGGDRVFHIGLHMTYGERCIHGNTPCQSICCFHSALLDPVMLVRIEPPEI